MNLNTINEIASELFLALKNQETIQPLSEKYEEININDAYQISRKFLSLREDQGEKVIGKKIGVTSSVVQEMLGVNQPDFGFLTNEMQVKNKSNFSIVDSRIDDWKIKIQDTIADNASCGIFVLGDGSSSPEKFPMDELEVIVYKNGEFLSSGFGSAVQGHPAEAVAWLANTLGEYDIPLLKGEFILSGSLVPLEPARAGDNFSLELKGVGTCEINFI